MVQRETVSEVYQDLKAMRDELVRNRENPHIIRLVNNLMKLTSLGDDAEEEAKQKAAEAETSNVVSIAKPECKQHVPNVFGTECMTCHEKLGVETEGEETPPESGAQ